MFSVGNFVEIYAFPFIRRIIYLKIKLYPTAGLNVNI